MPIKLFSQQDLIIVCLSSSINLNISSDHFSTSRSLLQWGQKRRKLRASSYFIPSTFVRTEPFIPCVFQQSPVEIELISAASQYFIEYWHFLVSTLSIPPPLFKRLPNTSSTSSTEGRKVLIFLTVTAGDQLVHKSNLHAPRGFCRLLHIILFPIWCSKEMPFWDQRFLLAASLKSTSYCWGKEET